MKRPNGLVMGKDKHERSRDSESRKSSRSDSHKKEEQSDQRMSASRCDRVKLDHILDQLSDRPSDVDIVRIDNSKMADPPAKAREAEISANETTAGSNMAAPFVPGAPTLNDVNVVEKIFSFMQALNDKIDAVKAPNADSAQPSSSRGPVHDISESEGECFSSDDASSDDQAHERAIDPLDMIDRLVSEAKAREQSSSDDSVSKAIAGLTGLFSSSDARGKPVFEKLAIAMNEALRSQPIDDFVKTTGEKYLIPSNIDNLVVPKTNSYVFESMAFGPRFLDLLLQKCQSILSKATVPLINFIGDVSAKAAKPPEDYIGAVGDSLRLITASFNYLSQTRKEIIKNDIKDPGLTKLCGWSTKVGQTELFPTDVAKQVDELRKVRKLRDSNPNKRSRKHHGSQGFRKDYRPYNRPSKGYNNASQSNQGYKRSRKPFLGNASKKGKPRPQ